MYVTGLSPRKKINGAVFLATPIYIPRVVRKSLCRQDKKNKKNKKKTREKDKKERKGGKKEGNEQFS